MIGRLNEDILGPIISKGEHGERQIELWIGEDLLYWPWDKDGGVKI